MNTSTEQKEPSPSPNQSVDDISSKESEEDKAPELSESTKKYTEEIENFIRPEDVTSIKELQRKTFKSVRDSRKRISEFNYRAEEEYKQIYPEFMSHQKMVVEMKQDLEFITKKIRSLKSRMENDPPSVQQPSE
eukprot:gb/GECH01001853.1/.p1 GENE.gb/GECH01001853.1/~~gb/GECH01001853.1/.p1  ORF type:complete len:134 (+),score=50.10 gb/GECH01001853.1/:1-402(+)